MKKLFLFVIMIICFILTGCMPSKQVTSDDGSGKLSIIPFEHNKHQYLRIQIFGYHSATILHDPDCRCHKGDK